MTRVLTPLQLESGTYQIVIDTIEGYVEIRKNLDTGTSMRRAMIAIPEIENRHVCAIEREDVVGYMRATVQTILEKHPLGNEDDELVHITPTSAQLERADLFAAGFINHMALHIEQGVHMLERDE